MNSQAVYDMLLQGARRALAGSASQYSKDGERWVTIGGGKDEGGGHPVRIDKDGNITAGFGAGRNVKDAFKKSGENSPSRVDKVLAAHPLKAADEATWKRAIEGGKSKEYVLSRPEMFVANYYFHEHMLEKDGNDSEESREQLRSAAVQFLSGVYEDYRRKYEKTDDPPRGKLTTLKISDLEFPGGLSDDVIPLRDNRDMPIIVRKTASGYRIQDGFGRASGMQNAGIKKIHAIVVSAADVKARGVSQGDDPEWVAAMHAKYASHSTMAKT